MKPHTLTVSAFGCLRREAVIDFDTLSADGLFLIDGGASVGKTTVLDALHFALFGTGADKPLARKACTLRSFYADDSEETRVELTFTHNGTRYRVIRCPSYQRSKLRGSGTFTVPASAELLCESTGERVSDLAEVDRCLCEILGKEDGVPFPRQLRGTEGMLGILTASGGDLTAMIRSLFGIDRYDEMEKTLRIAADERKQQLDAFDTVILHLLGKVTPVEESDRARFTVYRSDIRQLPLAIKELNELILKDKKELSPIITKIREKNALLHTVSLKMNTSKEHLETEKKLNELNERQRQLNEQSDDIDIMRYKLDKDTRARRVLYTEMHISTAEGEQKLPLERRDMRTARSGLLKFAEKHDLFRKDRDGSYYTPSIFDEPDDEGFISAEAWASAFLCDEDRSEMQKTLEKYDEEAASVKRRIRQLRERLRSLSSGEADEALAQYNAIKKERSKLEKNKKQLEKRIDDHSVIADLLDDHIRKRTELASITQKAADEYRAVAGLDSGTSLVLSELGKVFDAVLSHASGAYAVLTDGAYTLCRAGTDDPRLRAVLLPEVVDTRTGLHFGIDALSEAEMTLAALALRIGISKAMRKLPARREPEMLFLDGCFSAASDTEKQRISAVLKDYTADGGTVCLIERSGAFGQCIGNRLTLTGGADGSSVKTHLASVTEP